MIKLPLQYCGGKDDVFSKMMLRKLDTGWRGDTDPPPHFTACQNQFHILHRFKYERHR